jgi:deoxyribonuclease-4
MYHLSTELGSHTPFSGELYNTFKTSIDYGAYVTQFFLGNPYKYDRAQITEEDMKKSKDLLNRFPLHVFTHYPYVANLAGSIKCLAWNGNDKQDKIMELIVKSLEYELGVMAEFKGGVVIHPGSFKDHKKGIEAISKTINKINFPKGSTLVLENCAGQGTTIAGTLQELKEIKDGVDENKKKHIKFCLDTCHTFAYGEYDIRKVKEMERLFSDFEKILGLKNLALIHLNDSCDNLKDKKDHHACLGTGNIWSDNFDSLVFLLKFCKKNKIPCLLETHGLDMKTVYGLEQKYGI